MLFQALNLANHTHRYPIHSSFNMEHKTLQLVNDTAKKIPIHMQDDATHPINFTGPVFVPIKAKETKTIGLELDKCSSLEFKLQVHTDTIRPILKSPKEYTS